MLDFQMYEVKAKDRTESREIRYDKPLADLLREASIALGVDEESFIRSVIKKEASHVLEQGSVCVLSAKDAGIFADAMESSAPEQPTPHIKKIARLYRECVLNAGK